MTREYLGKRIEVEMIEDGENLVPCVKCNRPATRRTFARINGVSRWQTIIDTCGDHIGYAREQAEVIAEVLIERES